MLDIIKKKEIKGLLVSILLIVLSIFLIIKPDVMIETIIRVIGIFILICGVFDFTNYIVKREDTLVFNYELLKGIMEFSIGILFIFKYKTLIELFPMVLGLLIIFINVFKLELSLNLKHVDENRYLTGVIISSIAIVIGIVILLNPFASLKLVVIISGIILLISEIVNILYSTVVLKDIKKTNKVVKEITVNE